MKILVCIGHVPDTTTKVKFTSDMKQFDSTGVQWVINPWDELALTRALDLKDKLGGVIEKITVVHVGGTCNEATIRKALAMGADDAIRVDAEATDSMVIARLIADAVRDMGYDIIMAGIESSDFNSSAVGAMLAEFLQIPSISSVSHMDIEDGKVILKREIEGGKETIHINTPFVAIVQKGISINPRIPSMLGIRMSRQKPIHVVQPTIIPDATFEMDVFELPPAKSGCKMVAEDEIEKLVDLLHNEAKVI